MKTSRHSKSFALLGLSLALLPLSAEVRAIAEPKPANGGTCQEAWFNVNATGSNQEAAEVKTGKGPSILGFHVAQRYPQVEATGVKFSALLDVSFDRAKARLETQLNKRFNDCTNADGYRSCGSSQGPKQTVTLMEIREGKKPLTMMSCFQLAEK